MDSSKYHSYRSTCLPHETLPEKKDVENSSRQWCILQEGFPPGFTVDELQKHRKRRPRSNKPQDNLHQEPGSFKFVKTEYNRRFVTPPGEFLTQRTSSRLSNTQEWMTGKTDSQMIGEYKEKYLDFPRERPRPYKPESNLRPAKIPMDFQTEKMDRFIVYPKVQKTKPLRRNTALKCEGDLQTETETKHEFQPHGSLDRTLALKRPATLKMEGLFETLSSEQKEKYITYLANRPSLIKREPQLNLDGALEFSTECKDSYSCPGGQVRPPLRKRSTSLKLEGEVELAPEYRNSYTQPPPPGRPHAVRPSGNLHSQGHLDLETEFRSKYIPTKPTQIPMSAKYQDNIHLEGEHSLNPEYRDKFISHGKSKSEIIRRRDNLNLEGDISYETENFKYTPSFAANNADRKIGSSLSNSEYQSEYVNFPRGRPLVPRPSSNLQSIGPQEMTTESSRYTSHGTLPRATQRLRQQNLTTAGGIEGEPEYRNKFIEFPVKYSKSPKPADTFSQNYSSFQILDAVENKPVEPLLSSDPSPSFRFEVHNVDEKPQGFHRSPDRIFPREAVVSNTKFASKSEHEAALEAAQKRRKSHEQRASPVASYPRHSSKHYLDENANEPSFTVLDKSSGHAFPLPSNPTSDFQ